MKPQHLVRAFALCVVGLLTIESPLATAAEFIEQAGVLISGGADRFVRTRDPADLRAVYYRQLEAATEQEVYRGEGALTDIKAAPQGKYFGVIESWEESGVEKNEANYVVRANNENGDIVEHYFNVHSVLRVLSLDGEIITSLRDVRRYVWSPDGDKIAYITGTELEGGPGFVPNGAWIHDLRTQQDERLYQGGYDIQWASWDGNVYIYEPANDDSRIDIVLMFDSDRRELLQTRHKGIYFSPTGSRYFSQGFEGSGLRIYETETQAEIDTDLEIYRSGNPVTLYKATGWLNDNTLIVPTPFKDDAGDYLYGVDSRTFRQADGQILPTQESRQNPLVLKGGEVVESANVDLRVVR